MPEARRSRKTPMKIVSATGQLGTGFNESSLATAMRGADFIGCDGGSTDPGPYYLGSGHTQASEAALSRDLELMIQYAVESHVPAIIGSAGTAGGAPHVARVVDIVRQVARKRGWRLPVAVVESEIATDRLVDALAHNRLRPLSPAPAVSESSLRVGSRYVAMLGVEPFQDALTRGAQIVIAGRASDVSIFAALPLLRGYRPGPVYHAAKILECGAAASTERIYPDAMMAMVDDDEFVVEPPNPLMHCSPQSVAAHSLYENGNPFFLVEPGGTLDTTLCEYEQISDRAVRVRGSSFMPSEVYTVRLEGAALAGYRSIAPAEIRDPVVVGQLDEFLDACDRTARMKITESLGIHESLFQLNWRVIGRDNGAASSGPLKLVGHGIGLIIDIVAATQEVASAAISIAWHTALHNPVAGYSGLVSNLAFPFSPPSVDCGPVYEFCINHAFELDDPRESYELSVFEVS